MCGGWTQSGDAALSDRLSRAAAYIDQYDAKLSAVISQEVYTQTATTFEGDPAHEVKRARELKSQLLLLNVGNKTWASFRDVFSVDGKVLPDHVGRLAQLLATVPSGSAGAGSLASQIAWKSARYNLGGVTRNFNVPTMALAFLRRENQPRSVFKLAGTQDIDGRHATVLSFVERSRPTLVRGFPDGDVVASGRVWIEASGQVDKTELSLHSEDKVDATVTVSYAVLPTLPVPVPVSMHEHYQQSMMNSIEAFAKYSDFSVPNVTVDVEGFKLAAERTGRSGGGGQ